MSLPGAHVGELNCIGAVFTNSDGPALTAYGLTVDGNMFLNNAQCTGEVWLLGAHIKSQLDCTEAVFTNSAGRALAAERLTVDTRVVLSKARCAGEVRLLGAHVGELNCTEAVFTNPAGLALFADRLTVDADMGLFKAQCTGGVALHDAHIGNRLDCTEAVFANSAGPSVDLERASVVKEVWMRPVSLEGGLDLTRARVGVWHDEKRTWPDRIRLDGFVYDRISAPDATIRDRLRSWLPRSGYQPQPYEQLAAVCRREGDEQAARCVAISKQRARRADMRGWRRGPTRLWSAVLRWTIGYGYRPALALIPLDMLVLAGSVLFLVAYQDPSELHPAKTGPEQPSFNSFRYTMDLLLPVVNFKQREAFIAGGWAAWAAFGFTFAGWLLAAVIVAGLSGVFKRD